ncbi:hypothetical protein PBY51_003530 [Eleginops maclovinus]|uniref:Uncharacterized protein n=1 Tax=Eleginops maclovinus TaxID=56733 RepID=A0AAN8APT0_ELEMC|nr:hypothetical protein PBY51_003530 [Eleginops maclovinus]
MPTVVLQAEDAQSVDVMVVVRRRHRFLHQHVGRPGHSVGLHCSSRGEVEPWGCKAEEREEGGWVSSWRFRYFKQRDMEDEHLFQQ